MSTMTDAFLIEFVPRSRVADLERLLAAHQAALAASDKDGPSTDTMLDDDPVAALREEYMAAREAAVFKVWARPLSRREMRELKAQFPPRTTGDEDDLNADRRAGLNVDEAEDDIVCRALVEPAFASRAAYDEWADAQPPGMLGKVMIDVWEATTGVIINPKSLPASPIQNSG